MKDNKNDNSIKGSFDKQLLSGIISDLSDNSKLAVYMYYHESMSCDEISVALNKSLVDTEDILERSQEYIIEESGDPAILNYLSHFYDQDIKDKIHSGVDTAQINNNETDESDEVKSRPIARNNRINYKKIVLIAAALTLFASFVVLAMTYFLDNNPKDNEHNDDNIAPIEQNENSNDKEPNDNDDSGTDSHNEVGSSDVNNDPKDTESIITDPSGTVIQGKNGQIVFKSVDCKCGHVNPTDVSISGLTGKESHFKWEITDRAAKTSLKKGSGLKAGAFIKSFYENKQDGKYLLIYKFEDNKGDIVWIKRPFIIDSKPISENEYS